MPTNRSAAKRQRQNEKHRLRNREVRSRIHTRKRSFLEAIEKKDIDGARTAFDEAKKLIDSAAGKGVYHRNTADRKKSRLHKMLNSLEGETKA